VLPSRLTGLVATPRTPLCCSVSYVKTVPQLASSERGAAQAIYDACCGVKNSCTNWKNVSATASALGLPGCVLRAGCACCTCRHARALAGTIRHLRSRTRNHRGATPAECGRQRHQPVRCQHECVQRGWGADPAQHARCAMWRIRPAFWPPSIRMLRGTDGLWHELACTCCPCAMQAMTCPAHSHWSSSRTSRSCRC
jgi:hypothetical protein